MLVVVTNRPGDLDRAVLDRMDVVVKVCHRGTRIGEDLEERRGPSLEEAWRALAYADCAVAWQVDAPALPERCRLLQTFFSRYL